MRVSSALLTVLALCINHTFAQSTSITNIKPKSQKTDFQLTLEMETTSVRDGKNEVQGNETYYKLEPGFSLTNDFTILAGAQYKTREAGGTLKGAEKANRDHLEEIYLKTHYKAAKFKKNGLSDLTLQARIYSVQDDFFKQRYASTGNYQLRAYFGRPLVGQWHINKYVSYLRYKKYFINNESANDFTRDHEFRIRLAPTYRLNKNLELGVTSTYNHIFKLQNLKDELELNIDLSARYSINQYAAMIRMGAPYLDNNGGSDSFKINEEAGKDIGYALTLTAYL